MQWISTIVVFFTALLLGARKQKVQGRGWEFIQTVPGIVLLIIGSTVFQVEYAQKQAAALPKGRMQFVCDETTNAYGLTVKENCEMIYVTEAAPAASDPRKDFVDYVVGLFVSVLLDIPPEIVGLFLGGRLAGKNAAEF